MIRTLARILPAAVSAAVALGQCGGAKPAPTVPASGPGRSATITVVDCTHVSFTGSGFPAGETLLLGYGSTGGGRVVGSDGTFTAAMSRSPQEAALGGGYALVDLPSVGYHQRIDVAPCGG